MRVASLTANVKHKLDGRPRRRSRDKLDASAQGYPQEVLNWRDRRHKMNTVTRGTIHIDKSGNIDVEPNM